jgi:hypothetical protein
MLAIIMKVSAIVKKTFRITLDEKLEEEAAAKSFPATEGRLSAQRPLTKFKTATSVIDPATPACRLPIKQTGSTKKVPATGRNTWVLRRAGTERRPAFDGLIFSVELSTKVTPRETLGVIRPIGRIKEETGASLFPNLKLEEIETSRTPPSFELRKFGVVTFFQPRLKDDTGSIKVEFSTKVTPRETLGVIRPIGRINKEAVVEIDNGSGANPWLWLIISFEELTF